MDEISAEPELYLNYSTAMLLNSQLKKSFVDKMPRDVLPLIVVGISSLLFTVLFIFIPLYFSKAGRVKWTHKHRALGYFACLGAGFIIFELIFIQIFMKLIGYPLYTYSTVVFTLLLAAGLGSACSQSLGIDLNRGWFWPFVGIIGSGAALTFTYSVVFDYFLTLNISLRILISTAMIFPLGFFLGMPFPLGILAIRKQPRGAIAWAWGINGLFTVIGGLLSVLLSIYIGFKATLLIVLAIYAIAFFLFSQIRYSALDVGK